MNETILNRTTQINNATGLKGNKFNNVLIKCIFSANHASSTILGAEAIAVNKTISELLEHTF